MSRVILFDADGVLTLPEEMFSVVYSKSHGLDPMPFENFFKTEWHQIVTGVKDLKESIADNPDLWKWDGSIDELLEYWFNTEDVRNDELLKLISELKDKRMPCYLASDQEHHRANYMKNVMFKDIFDGYFVSAELGVTKTDPIFFEKTIQSLKEKHPDLKPEDVIFFDDSQSKVDTAKTTGIDARLFSSNQQIIDLLKGLRDE